MGLLLRWLVPFVAVLLAAYLLPGEVAVGSYGAAALFALVLAVLNAVVRPVIAFFTLPITCLTLGFFHFVLNAVMFAVAAALVPGIVVHGIVAALLGALIVSAVGVVMSMVAR